MAPWLPPSSSCRFVIARALPSRNISCRAGCASDLYPSGPAFMHAQPGLGSTGMFVGPLSRSQRNPPSACRNSAVPTLRPQAPAIFILLSAALTSAYQRPLLQA